MVILAYTLVYLLWFCGVVICTEFSVISVLEILEDLELRIFCSPAGF